MIGRMCNNRKFRKSFTGHEGAHLEVTCQPEALSYRDEGGRFNYLFAYFVLRVGHEGVPECIDGIREVEIGTELQYDDGTPVEEKRDEAGIRILGLAGPDKVKEAPAFLDAVKLTGSVRYKIMKLSRNHDQKKFRIKIFLKDVSEDVVKPAYTSATMLLSKRKWLKAEERTPEIDARKEVELRGLQENRTLGSFAKKEAARSQPSSPIRVLAGLDTIEVHYPEHASLHDEDNISTASPRLRASSSSMSAKRCRDTAPPVRRSSKVAKTAGNAIQEVLEQLNVLHKKMMENEEMYRDRIARVESENRELRDDIQNLQFLFTEMVPTKRSSFGKPSIGPPTVFQMAPLALPRSHSLQGPAATTGEEQPQQQELAMCSIMDMFD